MYALPGGNRDQQLCENEPDAEACAQRSVADRRVAGEDEEDRRMSALRTVHEEMSVRTQYTGTSGKEL